MWDLLLASLSRRLCPWCKSYNWYAPNWWHRLVFKVAPRYDYWVGTHGLRIHSRHYKEN